MDKLIFNTWVCSDLFVYLCINVFIHLIMANDTRDSGYLWIIVD